MLAALLIGLIVFSFVLVGISIEIHERCLRKNKYITLSKIGFCIATVIFISVLLFLIDIAPLLTK